MTNRLTQERLREVLSYDPDTGLFHWLTRRGSAAGGKAAGSLDNKGYVVIRVDRAKYRAHRLAWLYTFGRLPLEDLDHINGKKDDNRLENLREATRSQNMANTCRLRSNKSGYKGVYWEKAVGKWRAHIVVRGNRIHLGLFAEIHDAKKVYDEAAAQAFGEFARTA